VTPEVRETDPEGIDYGWIMQVTFIVTIVIGAPVVAALSLFTTLPTWSDRALFAVRVGAFVWLVTMVTVYAYARKYRENQAQKADPDEGSEQAENPDEKSDRDDSETTGEQTDVSAEQN